LQSHANAVVPVHSPLSPDAAPLLVFDGGCPFCRHFAALSELRGGIPDLRLCDGRRDHALRRDLADRGFPLSRGAIVLEGGRIHHGAAAIQWICARMAPSGPLLALLTPLFVDPVRARRLYPLLLAARRLALGLRGLPEDPDRLGVALDSAVTVSRSETTGC
jgi:predicted DCC family thiol-disulfide oxidoreductase YuxK